MKYSEVAVLKGKRRKCNTCGAGWFVDTYLESRSKIQGAVGDFASLTSGGVTRVAAIAAANTAQKGLQMDCPSCGNHDYVESSVLYTVNEPPRIPEPVASCPLCRKPVSIEAVKCPNCTGDIPAKESTKMKAEFSVAEKNFSRTQEILQERLAAQKAYRKRTNIITIVGMIIMFAYCVGILSMIELFNPDIILQTLWIVPLLYFISIIFASVTEKKKLIRFVESQKG